MNKKIQQLIRQSNGFWEYGDYGFPATVCFSEKDVVKFVENVVKECITIVDEEGCGEGGSVFAIMRLKKEFGIE